MLYNYTNLRIHLQVNINKITHQNKPNPKF